MPLPPILLLLGATPGPPAASADIPGGGGDLAGAIGYGRVIAQGFQSYQPVSFARSRDNKLVMVNGLTRGRIWDGVQGAAELLGLDAPTSQPSVSLTPSAGNAQAGIYLFAYRYVDSRGVPTSLSPARSRTASANDQFNWSVPRPTIGRIKTIELWRTPAGVIDPFYKAFTITVGGQVYASSNSSGSTKVAFTAAHGLVGGESIRFSGHSRLALNETNWTVVSVPDSLSVVISAAHSGSSSDNGFGGTWTRVGGSVTQTDVLPDPTLQLREALPINSGSNAGTAARELGARRFEPPVSNKAVVVYFQDRYWFAVDPIYDEGTVQVAHGSAVVTGTGTNFDQAMVGRQFFLKNPSTAFREPLTVGAVASATSLTLSTPLLGSTGSGLKYSIANPPELNDLLYFTYIDEPESLPAAQNNVVMQNNTGDADRLTGLMPAGSALFLLRERHIYRMTYHRQPQIDADITLAVARGCLNQRCWDNFEGLSYLLDQSGAYAFNGSSVEPISGPIQNYIRDGLIDLSAAKYFHVKVDPRIESVRFWVKFVGDTGTRPKRCFCYSVRTGFWWYESYATEIGASAQFNVDGVLRSVFGMGVGRDEFFSHAIGVSDGVSTAIRGAVASATASTLVDSAAPFTTTNPPPGASVVLLSGAGKGQVRRVASFGGDTTTLNVAPDWTVNPAAGDLYCVGGIPWRLRTKIFTYAGTLPERPNDSLGNPRGLHVSYRPTSNAHSLELARYLNHDANAVLGELDVNVGDPWTSRAGDRFVSLDMKSVRVEDIAQPGHAWLRTFDAQESTAQAPKYVTLELSGVQIDNQIELFDVLVEGAD